MSNDLEKFVRKNRDDFEDANPSGNVWWNIENSLPVKKDKKRFTIRHIYLWSSAAAVFFIALTSVYFVFIKEQPSKGPAETSTRQNEKEKTGVDNMILSMQYAAEFKEASEEVKNRQQELRTAIANDPELYRKFQSDLNALDSSYRVLKEQANQTANPDVLIKAMLDNLRLQAELLGRQLMIIHEYKTTKTSNNEKNI